MKLLNYGIISFCSRSEVVIYGAVGNGMLVALCVVGSVVADFHDGVWGVAVGLWYHWKCWAKIDGLKY